MGEASKAGTSGTGTIGCQLRPAMRYRIPAPALLFLFIALIIEVLFAVTREYGAQPDRVAETILILILTSSVYILSVFLASHTVSEHNSLLVLLLLAGVLFRVTLWPLASPLTDDLFRYRWEAMLQEAGGNPYEVRPGDEAWSSLRDETFERVGLKDFKSGYGPAWEILIWLTYLLVRVFTDEPLRQVFWLKAPAAVFDLATMGALLALLRERGFPVARIVAYAWSPLVVVEFWANGHNDAVAVFMVVLALWFAARQRWRGAWLALSLAVAFKLWPLILVPAFAVKSRRPLMALLVPAVFAVCALPYWTSVDENVRFMTGFVGGWSNNESLFSVVRWLAPDQYTAKYTAFILIGISTLWLAFRAWVLEKICLWTIVALLLLSSNCHPWYLAWFLPLLALYPDRGLLLWTALMPLAHSVWIGWSVLGVWDGSTGIRWLIYLPVFGIWLVQGCLRRTASLAPL